MSQERFPNPGEWVAISEHGCTCTVRDGEPQDNETWPQWLTKGCPLHDPNAAPCEGCGECGRQCGG